MPGGEAVGQHEDHADRQVDAGGEHHQRLRHGDEGEQHALVGGGLHDVGGEARPDGWRRRSTNIDDEDARAPAACRAARRASSASPSCVAAGLHAGLPAGSMLSALAISARSVISAPDELALDRAVVEHEHAVAAADQLVIVGRIEQDRRAGVGELAQQLVDLLLGADVDAARRIVEQDDARLASSATWR